MKTLSAAPLLLLITLFASACSDPNAVDDSDDGDGNLGALPTSVASPAANPTSPQKVQLGKLLFWDPLLSGARDVACATCHHPNSGYAENLDLSIGVGGIGLSASRRFASAAHGPFVKRNTPTVLNTAFNGMNVNGVYDPATAPMFDDIRVRSLELQSLKPMVTAEEMRGSAYTEAAALDSIVGRLKKIAMYRELFATAFGEGDISSPRISQAIAAFERTLVTTDSPFDRFMRGETDAMTEQQKRGMAEFTRVGCNACHSGPMFSDFRTHVIGVDNNAKLGSVDNGTNGTFAFRTLSLRNLRHTAPYMHNGTLASLPDVITFYNQARGRGNRGGRGQANGVALDPQMPRDVDNAADLIAFLDALSSDGFDMSAPASVPSGLSVGGNIR